MTNSIEKGKAGEKWLPVVGYEGLYQVSNLGRIKSVERIVDHPIVGKAKRKSVLLKPYINKHNGYAYASLSKNGKRIGKRIHVLIATAFWGRKNGYQVNHKNGIKHDNRLENLEWVTQSENMKHAYKNGLEVVTWNRPVIRLDDGMRFNSITEAVNFVGGNKAVSISRVCSGQRKHYKGYRWAYLEKLEALNGY